MGNLSAKNERVLRELIAEYDLGAAEDLILGGAVEYALILLSEPDRPRRVGAGRYGGAPDLPPSLPWPRAGDKYLNFLMQVNLAEVPPLAGSPLPAAGMLWLFLEDDDHCRKVKARVLFHDGDGKDLRECKPPPGEELVHDEYRDLAPHRLAFAPAIDLPEYGSGLYEQVKALVPRTAKGSARDRYVQLVDEAGAGEGDGQKVGQLLGLPPANGDDMRVNAHLAKSKLFDRMYDYEYREAEKGKLTAAAEPWRLLWRVWSCREVGTMIWDGGNFNVLAREADLAKRDFSKVYVEIVTG